MKWVIGYSPQTQVAVTVADVAYSRRGGGDISEHIIHCCVCGTAITATHFIVAVVNAVATTKTIARHSAEDTGGVLWDVLCVGVQL